MTIVEALQIALVDAQRARADAERAAMDAQGQLRAHADEIARLREQIGDSGQHRSDAGGSS